MTDEEMLSAMSELLERKIGERLQPVNEKLDGLEKKTGNLEKDMHHVVFLLENDMFPYLNNIGRYCMLTSERFMERSEKISSILTDIALLKQAVAKHSEILQSIQG